MHYTNRRHSNLLHRFCTLIIVFKAVVCLSIVYLCAHCPPTIYGTTLVILVMKQTNSLYQTFLYSLLVILSKGWGLVRTQVTRNEFKYLTIFLLVIYVLTSTINIIGQGALVLLLIILLVLFGHCFVYSFGTLKGLKHQIQAAIQARLASVVPSCIRKKKLFIAYIALFMSYFSMEIAFNSVIMGSLDSVDIFDESKDAILSIIQESYELGIVALVVYLYRATQQDPYFSINFFDFELQNVPRDIPFLKTAYRGIAGVETLVLKSAGGGLLVGSLSLNS